MRFSIYTWGLTPSMEGDLKPSMHFQLVADSLDEVFEILKVDKKTRSKINRKLKRLRKLVVDYDKISKEINDKINSWCKKAGVQLIRWETLIVAEVDRNGVRSLITLGTKNRLPELRSLVDKMKKLDKEINDLRFEIENTLRDYVNEVNEKLKHIKDVELKVKVSDSKLVSFKLVMS